METIILITDIVRSSLKFDSELTKGNYENLSQISNKIKTQLQKLKLISFEKTNLISLCEKLYKVNEYAINYVRKSITKLIKPNSNLMTNNMLLFFYINGCEPSKRFSKEWIKLSKSHEKKIKFISFNCNENEKCKELCKKFNIYEYPTIKYITPTKVHNYYGDLTADGIIREFKL